MREQFTIDKFQGKNRGWGKVDDEETTKLIDEQTEKKDDDETI
jgi:hypothetical protein